MYNNFKNGVASQGVPLLGNGSQDISGKTYFVDGNSGNDGNNGRTWEKAFKTLAVAFAASHADIALASQKHWARRNTIYIAGDRFIENLVIFPQKTDVIGVGSTDRFKNATIQGNHVPINSGTGCRFINVGFEPGSAADIMTLGVTVNGAEFWNCEFRAVSNLAITATGGIKTSGSPHLKVMNCTFAGAFANEYIDIAKGVTTGVIDGTVIQNNNMNGGADNGIMVTGTAILSGLTGSTRGLIKDNFIQCEDIVIDVNAISVFDVVNNICISGEALGASSYVIDLTYAANNIITGNDIGSRVPIVPSA